MSSSLCGHLCYDLWPMGLDLVTLMGTIHLHHSTSQPPTHPLIYSTHDLSKVGQSLLKNQQIQLAVSKVFFQ